MKIEQRLQRAFAALVEAVKSDAELGKRLEEALGIIEKPPKPKAEKSNRRDPAVLDPYADYALGEESLRSKLKELDIKALKDIVAQYGMDQSKLVMNWKTASKILDHIVTMARTRAEHGDAFRQ
jgi:hypothetical protein